MNSLDELADQMPEHDRLLLGGIVGSFTYRLGDTLSDTDIRYYVMPTLDDLLRSRKRRRIFLDGENDVQVHYIRRFPYFLNMGDLNQISVLFSPFLYIGESYMGYPICFWNGVKRLLRPFPPIFTVGEIYVRKKDGTAG